MAAFHVLVYFVFELFSVSLQGLDKVFHLEHVDVVVVGVGVDQQRCVLKLSGIPGRGSLLVFLDIIMGGLSLSNVAVSVAWEERNKSEDSDSIEMSKVGLEFTSLTPLQQTILDFFLSTEAAGNA